MRSFIPTATTSTSIRAFAWRRARDSTTTTRRRRPASSRSIRRRARRTALPIRAGGFYYTRGRDEPLLEWHLRIAKELGSSRAEHPDQAARCRRQAGDRRRRRRELPSGRRARRQARRNHPASKSTSTCGRSISAACLAVGELVEKRGVKFNITLDHSHVIFKIDNPREQEVQNMRADVEAGKRRARPVQARKRVDASGSTRNYVSHAHARPSAPANPVNIWAKHPDGSFGRGVQYPFLKPAPGEWHAEWDEDEARAVERSDAAAAGSPREPCRQRAGTDLDGNHPGDRLWRRR